MNDRLQIYIGALTPQHQKVVRQMFAQERLIGELDGLVRVCCCDDGPFDPDAEQLHVCHGQHRDRIAEINKELGGLD